MIPWYIVTAIMLFCILFEVATLGIVLFTIHSFIKEGIKWYNICTLLITIFCFLFMWALI